MKSEIATRNGVVVRLSTSSGISMISTRSVATMRVWWRRTSPLTAARRR